WDFCGELRERFTADDDIYKAAQKVQEAVEQVVMLSTYSGARFQHSHGIAIFFPWARIVDSKGGSDLSAYKDLKFANETGWARFLDRYFKETQRPPRTGQGQARTSHLNARPGIFGSLAEEKVKGGGVEDSKGGGVEDSKGFFLDESKGGGTEDSKGGGAEDSKSGLFLPNLKIGQMKNPPTDWYRLDLAKELDLAKKRARNTGVK